MGKENYYVYPRTPAVDNMLRVKITTTYICLKLEVGKKGPLVEKVVPSLGKQKSLLKNSKFQNIFQSSVVRIKMGPII